MCLCVFNNGYTELNAKYNHYCVMVVASLSHTITNITISLFELSIVQSLLLYTMHANNTLYC